MHIYTDIIIKVPRLKSVAEYFHRDWDMFIKEKKKKTKKKEKKEEKNQRYMLKRNNGKSPLYHVKR